MQGLGWFLILSCVGITFCSVGDRSNDFRSCTSRCHSLVCSDEGKVVELSLPLQFTGWTCLEDCQYKCMHEVTAQDVELKRPIRQFFGKWPFVRVLGIQEPASALFSVLNGLAVIIGYVKFRQTSEAYLYGKVIFLQFLVNLNAWVWSTIFHSRDLFWTEKLDYFSAGLFIVVGLIVQFVRISGCSAKWKSVYAGVWMSLFCCHVSYLTLFKFDYGYNMAASVTAGILYSAVWVVWCFKNRHERPYVWKCVLTVVATSCFVLLELLDFPPLWWIVDAHSLWHLSTVPLPLMWYSFLASDAQFEVQNKIRKHV